MPEVGEIKKGKEINKGDSNSHKYLWHKCLGCGKERWVVFCKGIPRFLYCHRCNVYRGGGGNGEKNPNWQGGRCKHSQGYILIKAPNHPRASKKWGYVLEHILIWEKVNGMFLPKGWVIHHLNGIRGDNRPENLFAVPQGAHHYALRMQTLQKRIRYLEQECLKFKAIRRLL